MVLLSSSGSSSSSGGDKFSQIRRSGELTSITMTKKSTYSPTYCQEREKRSNSSITACLLNSSNLLQQALPLNSLLLQLIPTALQVQVRVQLWVRVQVLGPRQSTAQCWRGVVETKVPMVATMLFQSNLKKFLRNSRLSQRL